MVLDWPIRCIEWGIFSRTMNSWLTIRLGIVTFENSFPTQFDAEKFVTEKIGDRNAAKQMIEIRPKKIIPMNQYRPKDV